MNLTSRTIEVEIPASMIVGLLQVYVQEQPTMQQYSNLGQLLRDKLDMVDPSQHNKITAIKYIREELGCGLKEAKDFVDAFDEMLRKHVVVKFKLVPVAQGADK